MGWKLFAVLSGVLYLNSLFYWFDGGYLPTLLHYGMLVMQLPLLAVTFSYAFDLDFASARTWRPSFWALVLLLAAKVIEDIGPLVRLNELAPHFTIRAIVGALAFIIFFDIFDLVILCVQGLALSRYIRRLNARATNAKLPHYNLPKPKLMFGVGNR
ncbi:hypothetical protein [Rhizobium mayense]|uniref:Transmembrane protein n=1 Tax=Rhizobium mayense TaxID=1312184 RepID=A0ABT7JZ68_9HYPH|nr:hypothetical protein [Rhizobium mayense]MDL2401620.1 hypothetical protein [Rhizobium mayense]